MAAIVKTHYIMRHKVRALSRTLGRTFLHPIKYLKFKYLQNKDFYDMTNKDFNEYERLYTYFKRTNF